MPLRSVTCSTCSTSVVHEGDHDGENNRLLRNVRGSSHDGPLVTTFAPTVAERQEEKGGLGAALSHFGGLRSRPDWRPAWLEMNGQELPPFARTIDSASVWPSRFRPCFRSLLSSPTAQ